MSKWHNYPEEMPPRKPEGFPAYVRMHAKESNQHVRVVSLEEIPCIFFGNVCISEEDEFLLDIAQWRSRRIRKSNTPKK